MRWKQTKRRKHSYSQFLLAKRNLANAVLLTDPDSGHGSLFQVHDSFTRQAAEFLTSDSRFALF